ncbi:uncharacterized protein LOC135121654 [Zophobas morio]|uniref:uncharacterized protein LOC135121654 n=1 Tax=Zophobas morio TaxID=2755281 RepID=UPI003082C0BF
MSTKYDDLKALTRNIQDVENQFYQIQQKYEQLRQKDPKKITNGEIISLYAHVELLDLLIQEKIRSGNMNLADVRDALNVMKEEKDYKSLLALKTQRGVLLLDLLKFISLTIFFFGFIIPYLIILWPLRILNPLFRRLGFSNNYLPSDCVSKFFAVSMLFMLGVKVHVVGLENVNSNRSYICMYNHTSGLDAFITQVASSVSFKWIGKHELKYVPIFGLLFWAYGNILVDRFNKEVAIKSLQNAVRKVKLHQRSIAISPEGTRSANGLLLTFKKGPFHTTQQAGLPVLPTVIYGAYEVWPRKRLAPGNGEVVVRFLKPIEYDENRTTNELSEIVRASFLSDMLEENLVPQARPLSKFRLLILVLSHFLSCYASYYLYIVKFSEYYKGFM